MTVDYQNMTEEQITLINEYCKDDMRKLKQICYIVWGQKGLPSCYHDDLYDDAINVLSESVITFNPNGNTKFKTYLISNICRSYKDWYRDNHLRAKRNNLELDENGKIKKDENGNPIIIQNISFDAPVNEDGLTLKDTVADIKTIEREFFDENKEAFSSKMQQYLNRLSILQKNILHLISIGYTPNEILGELHINKKQYDDCYAAIHSYRNISILM